ncbi:MAG: hypothetical protein IKU98_01460 [Bacteroidaceae bacterium]|nr:hypothetical protein [Bacteroidaceae bacterium]
MKCPYCNKNLDVSVNEIGDYYDSGYGVNRYYDEYHCECPFCGKMFKWYENYRRIEADCRKMEDN